MLSVHFLGYSLFILHVIAYSPPLRLSRSPLTGHHHRFHYDHSCIIYIYTVYTVYTENITVHSFVYEAFLVKRPILFVLKVGDSLGLVGVTNPIDIQLAICSLPQLDLLCPHKRPSCLTWRVLKQEKKKDSLKTPSSAL